MLRQKLNGMIHVPRLKHTNAAELLLGFHIRDRRSSRLSRSSNTGSKRFQEAAEPLRRQSVRWRANSRRTQSIRRHCVSLVLGHGRVFCRLVVSQTDVFHGLLLLHLFWVEASGAAVADFSVSVSSNEARQILI